ncbi:MAG: Inositol 2-dehydrogenase/D-chiro-inositol 3-dehydrogenase [Anaerolineales bacterium]|nr:Inositol 2-dehydrogenase/D-chiro-inositol 3-dehydrogenase [Anaerolineales bacterium]
MKNIHIGLIGTGGMGKAHATAFTNVPLVFGNEPGRPVLEIVADVDAKALERWAGEFGFARWTTNWRDVVEDPRVDVVDITTPNALHAEMAIAAAQAGKHIYCEKPLATTSADAARIVAAVEKSGVISIVGFNYLKNPAQAFAWQLIESGDLGEITLFRGTFDQDFLADPNIPFSWRMDRAQAGTGALGDLGSHTIAFAQFLVGDIAEVCGLNATRIKERIVPASGSGYASTAQNGGEKRVVENEDITEFLIRFENGAVGTIGTSRIGMGRKLGLGYEIQGTKGSLFYTQERMNEIQLYRDSDAEREKGYKTVYIGPEHPGYKAFFGLAGIGLGYNDQKIIEAHDLITAVALGQPAQPDVRFAYQVNKVIDAVDVSCRERRWVHVSEFDTEVDR